MLFTMSTLYDSGATVTRCLTVGGTVGMSTASEIRNPTNVSLLTAPVGIDADALPSEWYPPRDGTATA